MPHPPVLHEIRGVGLSLSLLSRGDQIPPGIYNQIHSTFKHAVNFHCDNHLITLCTPEICPGPWRMVIDYEMLERVQSIELKIDQMIIDREIIKLRDCPVYTTPVFKPVRDTAIPDQNLRLCKARFTQDATPECVWALAHAEDMDFGSFKGRLASDYRQGYAMFREHHVVQAITCFKSKGYGLTPGGDDFLIGMVLGFTWLGRVQKKELSEILPLLLNASWSDNLLVYTFFLQARDLWVDQNWKDFLTGLEAPSQAPVSAMGKIMQQGASSGYDILSGFFFAWELI